jgi:1-phosphatidylinositol-3-phosphate 5-kinase
MYYPSHFQALRKLYCGDFNRQAEQLFKSSFWADNTGGKSRSEFYRSYDEKLIMKVINSNEMRMFNDFAPSYFEYMCRSFFQKCPTSIGKILGAFRISMKVGQDRTTKSWNVILMESLTIGMNPKQMTIAKYDLKGSMSNRYVDVKTKGEHVTKLDTNFLEDRDSQPICMNYTMSRLMEIAIHNDTCFLHRYEKIDYSMLVWIDHERKLIRIGIIDFIQNYDLVKSLESKFKQGLYFGGHPPTILNPKSYKERFKRAMGNYFISLLSDQPCARFHQLMFEQKQQKAADETN